MHLPPWTSFFNKSLRGGLVSTGWIQVCSREAGPFSTASEMLGVVVDTSEKGVVTVDNKETRKLDLTTEIQKILETGSLRFDTLPAILGRVQYAELRISGREGKLAMADIRDSERHEAPRSTITLDDTCRHAFEILLSRITSGQPKRFLGDVPDKPVCVFTDGAVEPNSDGGVDATVGGVIIADNTTEVFGSKVDQQVLEEWLVELVHPVGLTELYGVAVAFNLWRRLLLGRRVIVFCDNWTAIDVYIKGSSPLRFWRQLLLTLERLDQSSGSLVWMARVPSSSNVADPRSRGKWDELEFLKPFTFCKPQCPVTGRALENLAVG